MDHDPADPADAPVGTLHHVELWTVDLPGAEASVGWLLGALGYVQTSRWSDGVRYDLGPTYVVLEAGPDVSGPHERRRAGVNHLAFRAGSPDDVDRLVVAAGAHGWSLMFADRHPFAGGPGHCAAYLENAEGTEVELVAAQAPRRDVMNR